MNKKFRVILTTLFSMIMLFAAFAPLAGATTLPGDDPDKPTHGTLILHKRQFNNDDIPKIEDHDGTEIPNLGAGPLAGVTFKVYRVADDLTTVPTDLTGLTQVLPLEGTTTIADGTATFANLPAGRYLVVEDTENLPHGVNYTSEDFLVDVPMMNAAGDGWLSTVHAYVKNRLILGTIAFQKHFEGDPEEATATFGIYKGEDLLETVATTDTGRVHFTNDGKGFETGTYTIKELSVSAPYGVNPTVLTVTVTNADHDSNLTDAIASINLLPETGFHNYTTTTPDKENLDDDNDGFSANIGETVTWEIDARIPANIDTYELFKFTDDIDDRLDYKGNIKYFIDGTEVTNLTPTVTAPTETSGGTLIIDFGPANLAQYAGKMLSIRFDTAINETAVMGDQIPNNVTLEFDNGSGITERIDEEPPYTVTGGAKFEKTSTMADADLEGAMFWVYRMNGTTKEYLQNDRTWSATNADPMELTSDEDGAFEVTGLSFGNYFLEERVALPGHILRADYPFTVDANTYNMSDPQDVLNRPRINLPETGGIGTIVFTLVGASLMAGAVKLYKKEE